MCIRNLLTPSDFGADQKQHSDFCVTVTSAPPDQFYFTIDQTRALVVYFSTMATAISVTSLTIVIKSLVRFVSKRSFATYDCLNYNLQTLNRCNF
jgi:hypothetical protein